MVNKGQRASVVGSSKNTKSVLLCCITTTLMYEFDLCNLQESGLTGALTAR